MVKRYIFQIDAKNKPEPNCTLKTHFQLSQLQFSASGDHCIILNIPNILCSMKKHMGLKIEELVTIQNWEQIFLDYVWYQELTSDSLKS